MVKGNKISREESMLHAVEKFRKSPAHEAQMKEREQKTRGWLMLNPMCITKDLREKYNFQAKSK